jgi:hypothetical protein
LDSFINDETDSLDMANDNEDDEWK